jgi:hypothetical protein
MAADPSKLIKRLDALKSKRSQFEQDWRSCFDMTFPERGSGFSGDVIDSTQARAKTASRLDSTGTDASRILASALMSGMTPANSRWFALDVGKESDEERRWLDDASDLIWQNIHASNFDAAGFECMMDVVPAGWCVIFADINRQVGGGYAFEQWPIAECFVSSTRQDGRVDTIYRRYKLNAAQAVETFGMENLSDKAQDKARNKPDSMIEFVRVIEPRKLYINDAKLSKNLPFTCCDAEVDGKHLVSEKGFHEFPCAVPRWTIVPGSSYAVGPVFHALPDLLELNELVRLEKAAADLAVSGMWIAEDDGVLNPRTIKVGPRKIIVANSVDSMKELKSGADFNVSFTMKAQLQAQIRKTLMADQLQPQDGPAMTATEVHVRVGMIRQLLGPVYGRLQSEYLQPFVERCFGLAFRAGVLGTPPETLRNREFHVRYISPLARAQRLEDVNAMDRVEAGILQKAQALPDLLDVYDFEEAEHLRAQYLGVPGRVMRTDKVVADIRKQRADQQAQQQQAQQQAQMAQAASGAAGGAGAQVMGAIAA